TRALFCGGADAAPAQKLTTTKHAETRPAFAKRRRGFSRHQSRRGHRDRHTPAGETARPSRGAERVNDVRRLTNGQTWPTPERRDERQHERDQREHEE